MLKVKVCGITRVDDAVLAAGEGADLIGLIFAVSPRKVNVRDAREIVRHLPAGTEAVGVFRDQPLDVVRGAIEGAGLPRAQLHGSESPEFCRAVGVPVFKTFEIFTKESFAALKGYDADAFLLDLPKGSHEERVDSEWAVRAKKYGKVLLAGKLTAENVAERVKRVRPWGVDSCSGTEKSPGVKDPSRLRDFIAAARAGRR